MSSLRRWCCLVCLLFCSAASAGRVEIVYPSDETGNDARYNDLHEILRGALERTVADFGPYTLQPSKVRMNEARYLTELKNRQSINIAWSSTSIQKEREFLPVRIPLRKGLLGYRVAFIAKGTQAKIDQVRTLDDLRKLTIGQGIGWGDVQLYSANGIRVATANYDNLFKMTALGRFDLFPRGIGELMTEYATFGKDNPNLAIERNLLIYYPWPYYFFFNQQDAALKERIEAGVRRMVKDGSFDAIFKKYNGKVIEQVNFKHRRIIRIRNDMLPKETPLNDAALWFDPSKD